MSSQYPLRADAAARIRPLGTGGLLPLALALAALAVQQLAIRLIPPGDGFDLLRQASFVLTTAVVLVVALRLRVLLGAWLVALGIVLNGLPMLAHGGTMPIAWETVSASNAFPEITAGMIGEQVPGSKDVLLHRNEIRFEWLSDRYFIDPPVYRPNVYSAGDFVIFVGVVVAVAELGLWVFGVSNPGSWRRLRGVDMPGAP